VGDFGFKQTLVSFLKVLVSTVAMALFLVVILNYWPVALPLFWELAWFSFVCLAAGLIYLLSTRLLKTEESEFLNKFFLKRNED